MEAVRLDELKAAKNFSTFKDLSNDVNESANMKNLLDNFITESNGRLKGEMWDKVGVQLSSFSNALAERMKLANNLSTAIQKALDILLNYMGEDYASLDYSQLPELEANKRNCENQIANIKASINNLLNMSSNEESDTANKLAYYNGQLTKYQNELQDLNQLIEKLKGLKVKYDEAEKILADAFSEVNLVGDKVANIAVGKTVTFMPK